jgi:uncharacterized membrane protein (DUF2068 family)
MDITLEGFKTTVLIILGNVFIIILALRALGSWAKKEWGEFATLIVSSIVIAGIIYFPNQAVEFLQWAWNLILG